MSSVRDRPLFCSDTEAAQKKLLGGGREKVCPGVRRTEARVQGVHSTEGERDEESTRVLRHAEQLQTTKLSDLVTTALAQEVPSLGG